MNLLQAPDCGGGAAIVATKINQALFAFENGSGADIETSCAGSRLGRDIAVGDAVSVSKREANCFPYNLLFNCAAGSDRNPFWVRSNSENRIRSC